MVEIDVVDEKAAGLLAILLRRHFLLTWIFNPGRHIHRWLCWLLEGLLGGGLDQGPDVADV